MYNSTPCCCADGYVVCNLEALIPVSPEGNIRKGNTSLSTAEYKHERVVG